eukprot:4059627-Heterocapsa_arctica.AAC.1
MANSSRPRARRGGRARPGHEGAAGGGQVAPRLPPDLPDLPQHPPPARGAAFGAEAVAEKAGVDDHEINKRVLRVNPHLEEDLGGDLGRPLELDS